MKYGILEMGNVEIDYLSKLSERLDVDYYDAEINLEILDQKPLINQVIEYIQNVGIEELDVSEDIKDILSDKAYQNSYDSGFNVIVEKDFGDQDSETKEIISNFITSFKY